MNLITCLIHAPLVAVSKRWPNKLHAAPMEAIATAWPDGTVTAPCGARGLRLVRIGDRVALWPPYAKGPAERCRECWLATGKRRPRKVAS